MDNYLNIDAGSYLIVGFYGKSPSKRLEKYIKDINPFGVIFFSRNIGSVEGVKKLNNFLNSVKNGYSENPLLTCIDQEGGFVARIKDRDFHFPAPYNFKYVEKKKYLSLGAYYSNFLLRACGFNVNLAPVLDFYSDKGAIGIRAFSDKLKEIIELSGLWIKGAKRSEILLSAKHFPGIGKTKIDTHYNLPVMNFGKNLISNVNVKPFIFAVNNGIDIIMLAHMVLKSTGGKRELVLNSRSVIEDLLRKRMNFKGLIFSDDLFMGAVKKNYDLYEVIKKAMIAGVDAFLVCHDEKYIFKAKECIKKVLNSGVIEEPILMESLKRKKKIMNRIKKMKELSLKDLEEKRKYASFVNRNISSSVVKILKLKDFYIYENACLILIKDKRGFYIEDSDFESDYIKDLLKKKGIKNIDIISITSMEDVNNLKKNAKKYSSYIVFIYDFANSNMEQKVVKFLDNSKKRYLIIIVKNPSDTSAIRKYKRANIIEMLSTNYYSLEKLINVIMEKRYEYKQAKI